MTADCGGELDGLCAAARQPSFLNTSTCERQQLGQLFLIESRVATAGANKAVAEALYSFVVGWDVYPFAPAYPQGAAQATLLTVHSAGSRCL
jgi:hypothetical protein